MPDKPDIPKVSKNGLGDYKSTEDLDRDGLDDDLEKTSKPEFPDVAGHEGNRDSALKRIFRSVLSTVAGENMAGKIGARVKDIVKRFVPFGREIDAVTDEIGNSLKTEPNEESNMNWLASRLKEKTTWAGIVTVLTALGASLSPDQKEAIITAGAALVGVILAFTKETKNPDA